VKLEVPAGTTDSTADDVDEDGTILGTVRAEGDQTGYLWLPDGTARQMPLPDVEYQMASYSDDGPVAAGHMTGIGTIENQPLIWRCRLTG